MSREVNTAARKSTRSARQGRSRAHQRRDEQIVLDLLGVRAAIEVCDMALRREPLSFHLQRHALLPLNAVLKRLGWKREL
jgi:hypothetical protein